MSKRQVFYSFYYKQDNWRVSQVRNIGTLKGNCLASDNEWESIKAGGDREIKRWINRQMKYRTCTVILVGSNTADRKWINHEIRQSWRKNMGIVGIYIHGLLGRDGLISRKGRNPFDGFKCNGKKLSRIVKCYDPIGNNSKKKYNWISKKLSLFIEEAIDIRKKYKLF